MEAFQQNAVDILKHPNSDNTGLLSEIYMDTDLFQRTLCEKLMQMQFKKYSHELESLRQTNQQQAVLI